MKKIKITTIILLIILVVMVSFFGIYTKVQNRMENKVKEYSLDMDLKGARYIKLSVNKENKDVVKDADGNEVESSESLTDEEVFKLRTFIVIASRFCFIIFKQAL